MPNNHSKRLLCLVSILCFPLTLQAEEARELFDLSFEELLRVNVVSGKSEAVVTSPGVVSVYQAEELLSLGLFTLPEMLAFATGVEVNDTLTGARSIQIRGMSDPNNQKVLMLLDGTPYWSSSDGNVPLLGIPVVAISRIEIIRGPASVVYGTNSSAGVINIVTKSSEDGQWSSTYSNNNFARLQGYQNATFSEGHIDFAFQYQKDNGFYTQARNTFGVFSPQCVCFPPIAESNIEQFDDSSAVYSRLFYKDWLVTAQAFESRSRVYSNGNVFSPALLKEFGQLIAVNKRQALPVGELRFFTEWNRYYWERDISNILGFLNIPGDGEINFDNSGDNTYRWRSGVHFEWDISTDFLFKSGVEFERRQTDNYKFREQSQGQALLALTQPPFSFPFVIEPDGSLILIEEGKINERALWFQLESQFNRNRLIAGVRYTNNEFTGKRVSPRVSWVHQIDDESSLKLLYGEGFNSPTFRQISGRNSFGIAQSSNVKAEIIKTWDLAYVHSDKNFHHVFSAYSTVAKNLIQISFLEVTNSEDAVKRSGLEYELNYQTQNVRWIGNAHYLMQGNKSISNDLAAKYASRWLLNLGAEYRIEQHQISSSVQYASKRANVPSYHQLNINYRFDQGPWRFSFGVNNVTDSSRWMADTRTLADIEVNAVSGRYWIFQVAYMFADHR